MDKHGYWSVESCRWEPCSARADVYWSVQRCRWEPRGPAADALATPWSMLAAAQAELASETQVPQQRHPHPGRVGA